MEIGNGKNWINIIGYNLLVAFRADFIVEKGERERSSPLRIWNNHVWKGSRKQDAWCARSRRVSLNHPSRSNPRGLKLKVDRAAEADSPLRALTRQSEKRRGAQQPRMSWGAVQWRETLDRDRAMRRRPPRRCDFYRLQNRIREKILSLYECVRNFGSELKTHRGNTMYGMLLESVQHFVQVNVIGVKEERRMITRWVSAFVCCSFRR